MIIIAFTQQHIQKQQGNKEVHVSDFTCFPYFAPQ